MDLDTLADRIDAKLAASNSDWRVDMLGDSTENGGTFLLNKRYGDYRPREWVTAELDGQDVKIVASIIL